MTTIGEPVDRGAIPTFPDSYIQQAQQVQQHAVKKRKRGKNPSMQFAGVRNPRKALQLADEYVASPQAIVVKRLSHLEELLPHRDPIIYDFGRYIAGLVDESVVPQAFILAAIFALLELRTGVVSENQALLGKLSQLTPLNSAYEKILLHAIPTIAKSVFPPDFAQHIQSSLDNILVLMGQSQIGPYTFQTQ